MNSAPRLFVILPAAGTSQRMGQPKLQLLWQGRPLMEHVLDAFGLPQIRARVVVCRRADEDLHKIAGEAGADVICRYEDPPDMKTSVTSAASYLDGEFKPAPNDAWLLCPADVPLLKKDAVQQIIDHWNVLTEERTDPTVLLPTCNGKHGHPVVLSWWYATQLENIPADEGIDWLIKQHPDAIHEFETSENAVLFDVDTPDDFEQLQKRQ